MFSRPVKRRGAALALRRGRAFYAEMFEENGVCTLSNADVIKFDDAFVRNGVLRDGEKLGKCLREALDFRWGKLPLAVGIPSSGCFFKTLSLPVKSLGEAEEALRWSFGDYFPMAWEDALLGIDTVPMPFASADMQFLAVVCPKREVMPLLTALKSWRSSVSFAEPDCVACARSLSSDADDGKDALSVIFADDVVHMCFTNGGYGVYFRSLSASSDVAGEVGKTMKYVGEKFGCRPNSISVFGGESDLDALRPLGYEVRKISMSDFRNIGYVPPAAPDWCDVAGLAMRTFL